MNMADKSLEELQVILRKKDQLIGELTMFNKVGKLMLPIKHLLPPSFVTEFLNLQPKDPDATPQSRDSL